MKRGKPGASHDHGALLKRYRVEDGKSFRLSDCDPGDTWTMTSKSDAQGLLRSGIEELTKFQERLFAQDRWSVLLVFQAMDAAGKDSTIEHVMSGVNPAGCHVVSFKAPTNEDLDHDWMWRHWRSLPERGKIGIFNRSHYEEVLVVRVHEELLRAQKIPGSLIGRSVFAERLRDIAAMEDFLARNGTLVVKFFLHVSREEQKRRFLERIETPEKNWKFSADDVRERAFWDDYMRAYEEAIRRTATPRAPWYVVPADHKWFMRLVVAAAVVDALRGLDLSLPPLTREHRAEIAAAKKTLLAEEER